MSLVPGPPSFCPHCGGAIGARHGDDSPTLHGFHTVTWPDTFKVVRLAVHRGALWVEVWWRGRRNQIRLLKAKPAEVVQSDVPKR